MVMFWVVAAALSAAAAGLVLQRAAGAAGVVGRDDPGRATYRRQLEEIDDLAERGLLAEGERKAALAEAGRRLLRADSSARAPWDADKRRGAVLATAILAPLLALAVYFAVGSPGAPDQPFAARLDQWRNSSLERLDPSRLAAVLKDLTAKHPNDPEAFRYLAMAEAAAGRMPEAAGALRHAIEIAPDRADLWEALSEVLLIEAQGEVSPEAEAALRETLKRDPKSLMARFHLARGRIAAGDREGGIAEWRALLAELKPDDERRKTLLAAIAEAEHPAAPRPPPAFAAGQMDAIRGMVTGLAARLETSPDDAEGWVRLVRSYAVLGEAAARDAALAKARDRFAGQPEVLKALAEAAAAPPMTTAQETQP